MEEGDEALEGDDDDDMHAGDELVDDAEDEQFVEQAGELAAAAGAERGWGAGVRAQAVGCERRGMAPSSAARQPSQRCGVARGAAWQCVQPALAVPISGPATQGSQANSFTPPPSPVLPSVCPALCRAV